MTDTDLAYEAGREDGIAEATKADPATLVRDLLARLPADARRAIVAEALDVDDVSRALVPVLGDAQAASFIYARSFLAALRDAATPEEAKP